MANKDGAYMYGYLQFILNGGSEICQSVNEIKYNQFGFWWEAHRLHYNRATKRNMNEIKLADIQEIYIITQKRRKVNLTECIQFLEHQQSEYHERTKNSSNTHRIGIK